LLGRQESGELDDSQAALLRLLTPIAKLLTAKQAVACVSEAIEAFGGAGYVEDTGLPTLLRDAQVLPIWEGTTNVLALDAVLRSGLGLGMRALRVRVDDCCASLRDEQLLGLGKRALGAIDQTHTWLTANADAERLQAGARRVAMTLGRALQLALLCEHAQWSLETDMDFSGIAAAKRFAATPFESLAAHDLQESKRLLD
jgi:acyl-CoA dehydrogenase